MPQLFADVVDAAPDGEKSLIRAQQAWQYLIAKANNRQIIRYGELGAIMGYNGHSGLRYPLGCIMWYCEQNDLPPLTLVVVGEGGVPGDGFTAATVEQYHRERERVFEHPWYRMLPPTVDELRDARVAGMARNPAMAGA